MNYWPGTNTPVSRRNAFDLSHAGFIAPQMMKVRHGTTPNAHQSIQIDPTPEATRAKHSRLLKANI